MNRMGKAGEKSLVWRADASVEGRTVSYRLYDVEGMKRKTYLIEACDGEEYAAMSLSGDDGSVAELWREILDGDVPVYCLSDILWDFCAKERKNHKKTLQGQGNMVK